MSTQVEIRKRTLLINSTSAIVERVLNLSVFVWVTAWLVQKITADEYSIYKGVAAVMVFMPLVALAVASGVARYVTEAYAQGNERRVTQIVSTTFPLFAAAALVLLVIGQVAAWNVDHLMTIGPELEAAARAQLVWETKIMVSVMVLQACVRMVLLPFLVGLLVRQKFVWLDAIGLCSELVRIGILFSLLFGIGPKVMFVVLAGFPATLLSLSAQCYLSFRLVPALRVRFSEIRRELIAPIVSMAGWSIVSRAVVAARQGAGILMLLPRPIQGAGWALGATVENTVFPSALKPLVTLQPAMTAMHATGQEARFRRYYFRFSRYILWGLMFLGVPLIVHREAFWALYIPDKIDLYWFTPTVMMLLYIKSVILFPLPMLAQVSLARARVRQLAERTALVDIATVIASILAVVAGAGAVGVAWAQLAVACVAGPIVYWTFGLALTDATMATFLRHTVLPGIAPACAALPASLIACIWIPDNGWAWLALHFAISGAVYAAVVVAVCEPVERQDLRKILDKARGVLTRSSRISVSTGE